MFSPPDTTTMELAFEKQANTTTLSTLERVSQGKDEEMIPRQCAEYVYHLEVSFAITRVVSTCFIFPL